MKRTDYDARPKFQATLAAGTGALSDDERRHEPGAAALALEGSAAPAQARAVEARLSEIAAIVRRTREKREARERAQRERESLTWEELRRAERAERKKKGGRPSRRQTEWINLGSLSPGEADGAQDAPGAGSSWRGPRQEGP